MKPILPVLALGLFLPCISPAQSCTPQGDEITYGTNNVWIGYVYDNINLTNYSGYVTEGNASDPAFDESFGGDNVNYSTNGCPVNTSTFSVRYRLRKTFASGSYTFVVGGDDGYRLSTDGGATWIINRWVDQGYGTTSATVSLDGTYDLVLEYYENGGGNRVSFSLTMNCSGTEDTSLYGSSNTWNGYIYTGNNFDAYKGMVTEGTSSSANFDEDFGGSNVLYPTSNCSVLTEDFSARYRLRKYFANGSYRFIVGADDGYRLSLDGGATWPISNWNGHSYTTTSYTTDLSGYTDLVLEFFENGGDNRVSFSAQTLVLLPVNLLSFSVSENNGSAHLKWQITGDSDPSWFEIQRSTDAVSFGAINRMQEQSGTAAGSLISYTYDDLLPASGTWYYRIKITDQNGGISYSPVVRLENSGSSANSNTLFPTIAAGNTVQLKVGKALQNARLTIYDLNGKLLQNKIAGRLNTGQTINILSNVSPLSKGIYILQVKDGTEDISRHRFIIP